MINLSLLALLAIVLSMMTTTATAFATPAQTDEPETESTDKPEPKQETPTEEPAPEDTPSEELDTAAQESNDDDIPLPEECKDLSPLACLEKTVGGPPPECKDLSPLACLEKTTRESPSKEKIDPCLLDPSDDSCPKPDPTTGECPPGFNMNEDGNCFPEHDSCPKGTHSHEDDETGRCIPDSTPCQPGYFMNSNHNCVNKARCDDAQNPGDECTPEKDRDRNHDGKDRDHDRKVIIIKKIHNTDIINKINNADDNNEDLDIEETIVAIDYDSGAGLNCVFDNDDNGACRTFDVTKDPGKEPLLQIIDFS